MFQHTFVLGNDQVIVFDIFIISNIYHFLNLFISLLYIWVFWLNVCLCVCPQRPEEAITSRGPGVTGSRQPLCGAGKELRSSATAASALKAPSHLSGLQIFIIFSKILVLIFEKCMNFSFPVL